MRRVVPASALLVVVLTFFACSGDASDECRNDLECAGGQVCRAARDFWCGEASGTPTGRRCFPEGSCATNANCFSGQWCACAGEPEVCCVEGWGNGSCEPCESDDRCGPQCENCAGQDSDRVCVSGLCGCLDAATDCAAGEKCQNHVCGLPETDCDNQVDDDRDGLTDCEDDEDCDCPREFRRRTVLGRGGFFGISGRTVGALNGAPNGSFVVGAHYASIAEEGQPLIQAGRLYFFDNGALPNGAEDAALVLEPPDGAELGGFAYAISNPCDFDHDGNQDLAVGNHLYSVGADTASGRVVVFWGAPAEPLSLGRASYHALSTDLRNRSDSLGQTVLCADFDGDGFDDLLATGQNAGAADTGIGAIYHGSEAGLSATQDQVLEPALLASSQYMGSSSLYEDLDGDGDRDLAVGAWGLIKGSNVLGPHTGGVVVFDGGTDWSQGPAYGVFPEGDEEIQAGGAVIFFDTGTRRFLAVGATGYGQPETGAVFVYETGGRDWHLGSPVNVLIPAAGYEGGNFGGSLAWVPDYVREEEGALLVGMRWADASPQKQGTGVVAVFHPAEGGASFEETHAVLLAPDPLPNDGFGSAIVPLDDVDGDGLRDFFVGTVQGAVLGDILTYGVILFH